MREVEIISKVRYDMQLIRKKKNKFKVGDLVFKPKGYEFISTVVAVFENSKGEKRVVAENGEGILHIFNEDNLEKVLL